MQNSMRNTQVHMLQPNHQLFVASVEQVQAGEITQVLIADLQQCIPNIAHVREVSVLQANDQILDSVTPQGAIFMQRLRKLGERPQVGFSIQEVGRLLFHNKNGITLKADAAKTEIRADGRMFVDSKEFYAIEGGMRCLQGATIELN